MSNMRDVPVLKAVAEVVKDHVGKAFAVLRGRIDGIEQKFNELPQPIAGPAGPPGPEGAAGLPGASGDAGPAGKDGAPGRDGTDGKDGIQGIAGKDGEKGADGLNGKAGEKGEAGHDGKDGIQGPAGIDGMAGKDGRDVVDGKDGAPGVDGKNGADGLNGKDGRDGIDGKNGADGIHGKDGAPGRDGLTGPQGLQGRDGSEGIAGKDAADLDPLPGIDESLSYQKGTWAFHRGGLIKSVRTTDPVKEGAIEAAGWAIAMNGIHEIVETLAPDGRTVIKSHVMTSGKSIVTKYKSYQQINQGVYKADREYERGDIATLAGSSWHANQTTKDRPGTSPAWTLVTKRGSDASMNGARK